MSSSWEPNVRVWTAELLLEVLPPSVEAAVSESAMVEADRLLMALPCLDGWCTVSDDRLIDDVVEKASAPGKPMARSVKAAAAVTST